MNCMTSTLDAKSQHMLVCILTAVKLATVHGSRLTCSVGMSYYIEKRQSFQYLKPRFSTINFGLIDLVLVMMQRILMIKRVM